jgi:hypothetical protein
MWMKVAVARFSELAGRLPNKHKKIKTLLLLPQKSSPGNK